VARVGVSITKSCAFRNSTQEFSNVYYYQATSGGLPNETDAEGIIDTVVTREKAVHSSNVTFVRARLWSQEGSPAQNQMIKQKNLSGVGSIGNTTNMDRERCFLIRIRAGVDSRGNPVYLRKWYHTLGPVAAVAISQAILEGTAGFSQAQRDTIENAFANILEVNQGGQIWELVSKNGRAYSLPADLVAHAFLEHHQFGDMWRAQ
jgi:hypothetical protein